MNSTLSRKLRFLFCNDKRDIRYISILVVVYIVNVAGWSYLALFRLYHVYSAVFDLGTFAESIWLPLHTNPTFKVLLYNIFYVSIIPYFLSPLSLFGGLKIILIVQTFFIWATALPLYFISRKFNISPVLSLLISISYFLYFPIAGINWFDVHNQAFFPFFFVISYMLYLYGYRKASLTFFMITALIKWPYGIFVALFAFYELVSYIYKRNKNADNKKLIYLLMLFVFSVSALIFGYSISFIGGHVSASLIHANASTGAYQLGSVSITFVMILAPLFFLPLFSKRWILFLIPFSALMFIARNPIYFFPDIYTDQYLSMLVPFLFLGLIDVISRRNDADYKLTIPQKRLRKIYNRVRTNQTTKTVLSILIFLVLFSLVFQPWSPYVNDNGYINWYRDNPYDNFNTYTYLKEETGMIPRSNPYVLAPNNIPEVYPRALVGGPYHVGQFVMGAPSPVFLNITLRDAVNNTFPFIASGGHIVYVPMDYAISTITNAVSFVKSGYQSIVQIMDIMLLSGKYGIMAEANGTIALERNYTYPPALYIPMNRYIGVTLGDSPTANIAKSNSLIFSNISAGSTLWYGGTNYYPGTYNDTLNFISYPESYGNISVTVMLNGTDVSEKYINIHNNLAKECHDISFNQVINNINLNTGYYYFIIKSNGFTGKIAFKGINEKEVSYKW
ncbi:DUF2079 domain-containing protein [Cuniculiplasma divulgatum]|uniref:Multipass membrane protein n=1 Tax=Cuniculiplasma divulgatum TaxID=1673428 RepID=A0A1N5UJ98_9ARCH|nr:DUF2079 domain-containing protein [Cuniculiplasma divulgatum]SIM60666.1 multipass membrane protein [Cuniculiplasma divulgatum]SJK84834.1 multipass membrane protein [Cuniculiplasma divulgatum]